MPDIAQPTSKPAHKRGRQNFAALHARPLPLTTYPLPAFIPSNPLSLLRLAYAFLSQYLFPPTSHADGSGRILAYYSAATRSVHVVDPSAIRLLWECGFFGKGSLSRSEPEWLERERRKRGLLDAAPSQTAAEITRKRREERRDVKRERAKVEREALEKQLREEGKLPVVEIMVDKDANMNEDAPDGTAAEKEKAQEASGVLPNEQVKQPSETQPSTATSETVEIINQEHLQLTPSETFFLAYGLGVLDIVDPTTKTLLSSPQLLRLFRKTATFPPSHELAAQEPDDPFMLNYVVYHHFRSLGWVVRPGIKFSVDYLLYNRGPVFSHAEFGVLILPSYSHDYWSATPERKAAISKKERKSWWWLHCANRVQSQVRKSLVLVYVEVPPPLEHDNGEDVGKLLKSYKVREFVLKRWSANRNRD